MLDSKDFKIEVFTKDDIGKDADNLYCAIMMQYNSKMGWFNTGIVVREKDPIVAFTKVMERAKLKGYWK